MVYHTQNAIAKKIVISKKEGAIVEAGRPSASDGKHKVNQAHGCVKGTEEINFAVYKYVYVSWL